MSKTVFEILEELESNNSRLFKEDVLDLHKKNVLLRRTFVVTSDPYINYYVNKVKFTPRAESRHPDDYALTCFLSHLTRLSKRELVGGGARRATEDFLGELDSRQSSWCKRILLRNLRVGVLEATINKVWPSALPKFQVQLAESIKTEKTTNGVVSKTKLVYPKRVEPKLDGLRCIVFKSGGKVNMFARSGRPIDTLPHLVRVLEAAPWDDLVLDAEVLGTDWNETASVVMSKKNTKDTSNMVLHVFDAVPVFDWKSSACSMPADIRHLAAEEVVRLTNHSDVVLVPSEIAQSWSDVLRIYDKHVTAGFEGVMIKTVGAPYRFKRTDDVLKFKPVATAELVVVEHYLANVGSKREGQWGGFTGLAKNGVTTDVGGGYNDAFRLEVAARGPDTYLGSVIEVEYQPDPSTPDGYTCDGKLRFPVFVRVRPPADCDPIYKSLYDQYTTTRGSQV